MKKGIKISMDILEENFKLHYRPLCMYATSMLGTTDNVEDIVLDCFVKLWDVLKVKHCPRYPRIDPLALLEN